MKAKKYFLVYQAGIANVFEVETFNLDKSEKRRFRILQSDFRTCEGVALGLKIGGHKVLACGCNQAGDITNETWTDDLESLPFSEKFSFKP